MNSPYRTSQPPPLPPRQREDEERWPDADVVVPIAMTLAAALAQVASQMVDDEASTGYGLAVGTVLACLMLLKSFARACFRGLSPRSRRHPR